eukprot:g441.t1
MIVVGSGGHTREMLALLSCLESDLGTKYKPLHCILAATDHTSRDKLQASLPSVIQSHLIFHTIPRSREVGQSFLTSIPTTLRAILYSLSLVWRIRPKLLLINGPGTCVPIAFAVSLTRLTSSSLFSIFHFLTFHVFRRMKEDSVELPSIIFVESFCRVSTLSLSGYILLPLVDRFLVQWPAVHDKFKRSWNVEYIGKLM